MPILTDALPGAHRHLRCLIVDDDPTAVQVLLQCVASTPNLQVIGTCPDALAALAFLRTYPVDLLFLDVSLPVLSGLELIPLLQKLPQRPHVILVSANPQHAVEAFTHSVADYLLKPLRLPRFLQAVHRVEVLAADKTRFPTDFLFVRTGGQLVRINFADVYYLEASGGRVRIETAHSTCYVHSTLRALVQRFPRQRFFAPHRSFLVNLGRVDWVDDEQLRIKGRLLPISPLLRSQLLTQLNLL